MKKQDILRRFELTAVKPLENVNPEPEAETPNCRVFMNHAGWYIGAAQFGGQLYAVALTGAKVPRWFAHRDFCLNVTETLVKQAAEDWARIPGLYR
jgi:hypothetical protein